MPFTKNRNSIRLFIMSTLLSLSDKLTFWALDFSSLVSGHTQYDTALLAENKGLPPVADELGTRLTPVPTLCCPVL